MAQGIIDFQGALDDFSVVADIAHDHQGVAQLLRESAKLICSQACILTDGGQGITHRHKADPSLIAVENQMSRITARDSKGLCHLDSHGGRLSQLIGACLEIQASQSRHGFHCGCNCSTTLKGCFQSLGQKHAASANVAGKRFEALLHGIQLSCGQLVDLSKE